MRELFRASEKGSAYISAPFYGATPKETWLNIEAAKKYATHCTYSDDLLNPRCVQDALPYLFDERIIKEKALMTKIKNEIIDLCDEVYVCGDKITASMNSELIHAFKHKINIRCFHEETLREINKTKNALGVDIKVRYTSDRILGGDILEKPDVSRCS